MPESGSGDGTDHGGGSHHLNSRQEQEYWRRNLRLVGVLLVIWFAVSYGAGILLVEPLNTFRLPGTGFPLGFWFAQQGSILVFVVLIFVYVRMMNRLDVEFDVDEGPGS